MKKKTRKSAAKRFKITKTGKVLFAHQNQGHLRVHKSKRRQRRQAEPGVLIGVLVGIGLLIKFIKPKDQYQKVIQTHKHLKLKRQ